MKSKYNSTLAAIGGALLTALAVSPTALALTYTWDPANTANGTTIDAGNGNWNTITTDLGGTNTVWNTAGSNVIWAQTSAIVPLHSAVFSAADDLGTYAITVGESLAANGLTFSNSGYTLSAASGVSIRVTAATGISVAAGKSATIGTNVTVQKNSGFIISGGGTLNITGVVRTSSGNGAIRITGGTTVNVGTGGQLNAGAGMNVGEGTSGSVNVNGGTMSFGGDAATNVLALANNAAAVSADFTLTSGTVTNGANSGGLQFGSSAANSGSSTFHLDGGTLTVARVFEGETSHTSTFNFNGGTLTTDTGSTAAATFMAGIDTVNVRNGGAIFNTNGVDTTVAQVLAHSAIGGDTAIDGGLTKNGAGTLTLTGPNTYTGITTVNGGTLAVNGSSINNSNQLTIDGGVVNLTGAETVNKLFFGTTQQAAGTWGSSSTLPIPDNVDDTRFTGSGTLIVSTGPAPSSGYATWQSNNSTSQTANLDHDNDGVSNGVEYFLGGTGNTTGFTTPLPGVTDTAGTLSVTWIRNPGFTGFPANYGTAFLVETSATLANPWTAAVQGVGAGFVEISGNNVKYTFPAGIKNFARLKVVAP